MSQKEKSQILKVSEKRWEQAQHWELSVWEKKDNVTLGLRDKLVHSLVKNIEKLYLKNLSKPGMLDDWNHWWHKKFNKFNFLPKSIDNAIEIGCGPYTNIRLLTNKTNIKHLFCSDPLAHHYIKFNHGWLSWAHKNLNILIDNHPAEETPFASNYFDLVIMINVLDHVKNAEKCLEQAIRITKSQGLLVIGQDLTNEDDVKNNPEEDIGHPIKIHQSTLDQSLLKEFEPIIHKTLDRNEGRNPKAHYGTYLFAGTKKHGPN